MAVCPVSPKAGTGEIQDSVFLFLFLLYPFYIPKSCFPSSLSISKVTACLHLSSSLSVCSLSPHLVNLWLSDDQDKVHEPISHLKKTLKILIYLKGEFLLFSNRPNTPEGNRNWFSPYLGAALPNTQFPVLPKPFHQGLTSAAEFVTKYLLTTISCY